MYTSKLQQGIIDVIKEHCRVEDGQLDNLTNLEIVMTPTSTTIEVTVIIPPAKSLFSNEVSRTMSYTFKPVTKLELVEIKNG